MKTIRIATRQSPLALAQAETVKQALLTAYPQMNAIIHPLMTEGDRRLDVSLAKIGGKGLFTAALEEALLSGRVDIAVHSMKDMPAELPEPFTMLSALPRLDARDVLISRATTSPQPLPDGTCVGTSSLRRALQLQQHYPNITIVPLRGNIHTRLDKLHSGQYDAIILALAGLQRLNMQEQVTHRFPTSQLLPAIGQGALAIEFCRDNGTLRQWLEPLCHHHTQACIEAERAVAQYLEADCHTPVAAYAEIDRDTITLDALVTNGHETLYKQMRANKTAARQLGQQMAATLIAEGAKTLLSTLENP